MKIWILQRASMILATSTRRKTLEDLVFSDFVKRKDYKIIKSSVNADLCYVVHKDTGIVEYELLRFKVL